MLDGDHTMNVKIFKKNFCPHCTEVRNVLTERNINFQETDLSDDEELFEKLKKATLQQTFPYVFVDDNFVGGAEELKRYLLLREILG